MIKKLTEELCAAGTISDFVAPVCFRFLHTRNPQLFGWSTAVLLCGLLLIEHHRVSALQGSEPADRVADLLRFANLLSLSDATQRVTASALALSLSDSLVRAAIVSNTSALEATLCWCSEVLNAASATAATQDPVLQDLVTLVARLVRRLVNELVGAALACLSLLPGVEGAQSSDSGAPAHDDMDTGRSVLRSLLRYLIDVVPASRGVRNPIGMQRAAQSCLVAVAGICRHPAAVAVLEADLPAFLAM